MSTSNGGSSPDTGGTATTAGRDSSGLLITGRLRRRMATVAATVVLVLTGLGLAVPSIASAANTAPAHRSCSTTWGWTRTSSQMEATVSRMSPNGCNRVWARALCRRGTTGGTTVNGVAITAVPGDTSHARCPSGETVAKGWVVTFPLGGSKVAHPVWP